VFDPILQAISEFETIILHRHARPDGDAMGSQIGLKHLILENFPGKTVYMVGDEAGHLSFMEDSVMN
jgi:phosphoesterase RecJ-like protein